ncbi:MAG: hypothetical protein ACO4B6_09150, partial [Ilumatobacteraceae bacterium]
MSVMTKRGRAGRAALNLFAAFGFLYLFLPIAFIVAFSFNDPQGKFNIVWSKFTLDNWKEPFSDRGLTDAFVTSLQIAAVSTLIATVLGSMIAIALSRYRFKGSAAYNFVLVLPLTTPEIVLGSSLATLFLGQSVVDFGFTTIVIAHRLSTPAGADRIVLLDRGRVGDVGTPDDLRRRSGLYARLWEIQGEVEREALAGLEGGAAS